MTYQILPEEHSPNIDLADNLVEERIKELRETFIACFSPPSDTDCTLTWKLYRTICEYHNLESNGRSEDEGNRLEDSLLEFFNRQKQLPAYRFKEFLEDYTEGFI